MSNPLLLWAARLEEPGCWPSSGRALREYVNDCQIISHWSFNASGLLCDEYIKLHPTAAKWEQNDFVWGACRTMYTMPVPVRDWLLLHPRGELAFKFVETVENVDLKAFAKLLRWMDKDATNAPDFIMRRAKEIMESQK